MASATLQNIVDQLQENRKASEDTTTSVKDVAELIRKQIEASRLMVENNAQNRNEAAREASRLSGGAAGGGAGGFLGGSGGLLGGLGSLIGGVGSGAGMAGLGIGALLAGGGYFLQALENFDGKKVKENVLELFAISEAFNGGMLQFFAEGGLFGSAMTGIGIGLAAFGVGSAAVGLSDALNNFFGVEDWAQSVKDNVITLLSIADGIGANVSFLLEGAIFGLAMTGLGVGLAAFSVGQAATGLAQFVTTDDWASRVKDSVATLLSISELPGVGWNTAGFVAVMGGLGLGLAAFALGKGANVVVEGAEQALAYFTGAEPFAERIKNEVATLLSISELPGVGWDTAGFIGVMGGLALGLTAFALGKGVGVAVEGMDRALAYFTGAEPFAERIKNEVATLLSIPGLVAEGSTEKFITTMTAIRDGLTSFALGQFVGTLGNAGAAIVSFFTGAESPFDQIRQIAGDADNLMKAAGALDKIAAALEKFGAISFDAGNLNFKEMAEQLGYAIPTLKALAVGGLVEGSAGWFSGGITFPEGGILNPNLKLDEMADAIAKVNYVLGQTTTYPVNAQPIPSTSGADLTAANSAAQASVFNAPVYNYTTNNYGGGQTSLMTVPVSTGDSLDRRDGIRYGR